MIRDVLASPIYSAPRLSPAAAEPTPVDAFIDSGVTPGDAIRALNELPRVEKKGHRYSVGEKAVGPDGTLYLSYKEWQRDGAGYVSAVRPDGGIAWEAPCNGVQAMTVDAEGVLHVATHAEHVTFAPDGRETGRAALPVPLERAWIDPSGKVVGHGADRKLVGGPDLGDIPVLEFKPRGDTLMLRRSGEWLEITASEVRQRRALPNNEQQGKVWVSVDEAYPLPDGGTLLQMRQTIELRRPGGFYPHRFLVGGMSMHEPDPGEYITRTSLRRLDAAGNKAWETESLGESTRVAIARDGKIYAAVEGRVMTIGDEGKPREVAALKPLISGLVAVEDALVVSSGAGISVVRGDAVSTLPDSTSWTAKAALGTDRALLTDNFGKSAAVLDLRAGTITPVTDAEGDHATGRTGELTRLATREAASGPPPTVILEETHVQLGDVRVERNRS